LFIKNAASLNHRTLHMPKLHVTHLETEGFFGNAKEGRGVIGQRDGKSPDVRLGSIEALGL
jgi:hypothetical protein